MAGRAIWVVAFALLSMPLVAPLSAQMVRAIPDDPCADPSLRLLLSSLPAAMLPEGSSPAANQTAGHPAPLVQQLIASRFPELTRVQVRMRPFKSQSDYFRTRFSLSRFFLLRRMRYFLDVNSRLYALSPPPSGVCAIVGHELAHISTLSHGNRIRLFGLIRLLSPGYTTRFERRADLEAIQRGFAPGLKDYRAWIYDNIPASSVARKKRDYFTPAEIEAIVARLGEDPGLLDRWKHHVPLSQAQIQQAP